MQSSVSTFAPLDYHMHSNASCDSRASMAEMCRSAMSRGIYEVAFTEHLDLHPDDSCTRYYKPEVYFERLAAARHELAPHGMMIRAGIEIGEIHRWGDEIRPILEAWPYDVVLGSMHWVGDNSVFDAEFFRTHTEQETIEAYFIELEQMVRVGGFDVLSHPDVIKRVAYTVYGHFDITQWEDVVRPVWQACIDMGIGIEINTAGLRIEVNQAHPAIEALRWYREMGGELLTFGSDAHRPEHVGYGLASVMDIARQAGFDHVCSYEQHQVVRRITL